MILIYRQSLSWPEKLRLAQRVRESVRQWRARTSPRIQRSADHVRSGTGANKDLTKAVGK